MGVRVAYDHSEGVACLYCSTSGFALGPIFRSDEQAVDFLQWLDLDPRTLTDGQLKDYYSQWFDERIDPATDDLREAAPA